MPDEAGNLNDQDWMVALGWEDAPTEPTADAPQAIPQSTAAAPATTVPPITTAATPFTGPSTAVPQVVQPAVAPTAPAPDYAAQNAQLQDQNDRLFLQGAINQYAERLTAQYGSEVAQMTAQQWGAQKWAEYKLTQSEHRATTASHQTTVNQVAAEFGCDPALIQGYEDPNVMRAAAKQFGDIAKLQAAVGNPNLAPVQQFAGASATPGVSHANKQLAYVAGDPNATMNAEEFEQVWGFDPRA